MSGRKWACMVLGALALVLALWCALNVAVDPFNAFGDRLMHWDSYTQTLNPRNSKAVWLAGHLDSYDGYILGSSSAASYRPETLERCLGGSFYNAFHYGADLSYDRQLVSYLLENDDDVQRIVLVLGLSDANRSHADASSLAGRTNWRVSGESRLSYYTAYLFADPNYALEKLRSRRIDTILPQPFDVFVPESGVYDKRVRDVEPIGSLEAYLDEHGEDFAAGTAAPTALADIDGCVEQVRQIRALCDGAGVELTVILSPVYQSQLAQYTTESINEFFTKLAAVTDYWNFAVSTLSGDARYFYGATHTRNATADMVLACLYPSDAQTAYDGLGLYCEQGATVTLREDATPEAASTATVPILLYHHLSETQPESATVLHPDTFAHQMALLAENGYQSVTFDDCIAFVESGTPLPEKAVIITFDDGYRSNYELAYPILEQYGLDATIFVIGCSVGHGQYYKNTTYEMTPHFGRDEIAEMTASGRITIASHTYDMHQWAPFESGDAVRESILPFEDEGEADYIEALTLDVALQRRLFDGFGLAESRVLAYPMGQWSTLTNVVLRECGYKVTVTTDSGRENTLVAGLPQSLYCLGRMTVSGETTDAQLLAYLAQGQ